MFFNRTYLSEWDFKMMQADFSLIESIRRILYVYYTIIVKLREQSVLVRGSLVNIVQQGSFTLTRSYTLRARMFYYPIT